MEHVEFKDILYLSITIVSSALAAIITYIATRPKQLIQSPELTKDKKVIDLLQIWYRKSRPFVVAALAIALMTLSVFKDSEYRIGVLLSLGVAIVYLTIDIYKLVKENISDFKSSFKSLDDKIESSKTSFNENIKNVQDPLSKAAYGGSLGKPEVQVAVKLFKASKEAARQLEHPTQVFKNHEDYTNELLRRIEQMILMKRGSIFAACGEKDWEHPSTKRWFTRNFEALKSNISINRIFVEELNWNSATAKQQMETQANKGINVRLAGIEGLKNHPLLNNIPKGFGFVIFDYENNKPEVIVHNDPKTEKSVLFDDPMIVAQFKSTFVELSSDSYSEKIQSNNQTDIGIRLEKEILQMSEEMTMHIKHLLDHRFSNLQLNFINWRFKTELEKIRKVLNGEVPIYAYDKFAYLGDIFGHILDQLREGDIYQTVSTVEIWNEENIGNQKFVRKTGLALRRKAKIDRVVFIDKRKFLNESELEYHQMVKNTIDLFDNFHEKDNELNSIMFFIDYIDGAFRELLQYAPVVLIIESGNKNKLGIHTNHVNNAPIKSPSLNLKFYIEKDSDEHSDAFEENFEPIKTRSITISEMKDEWTKRFPKHDG